MANEVLIVLAHFNLAAAAATLAVLAARGPIRERFGAEVAYRLWIGVPLAAPGPPSCPPPGRRWGAAASAGPPAPPPPVLTLWLVGAAIGVLVLAAAQMRFLALA